MSAVAPDTIQLPPGYGSRCLKTDAGRVVCMVLSLWLPGLGSLGWKLGLEVASSVDVGEELMILTAGEKTLSKFKFKVGAPKIFVVVFSCSANPFHFHFSLLLAGSPPSGASSRCDGPVGCRNSAIG